MTYTHVGNYYLWHFALDIMCPWAHIRLMFRDLDCNYAVFRSGLIVSWARGIPEPGMICYKHSWELTSKISRELVEDLQGKSVTIYKLKRLLKRVIKHD